MGNACRIRSWPGLLLRIKIEAVVIGPSRDKWEGQCVGNLCYRSSQSSYLLSLAISSRGTAKGQSP